MIQARLTEGYCIDTCALIDLWRRFYPPDIFKKLWKDIEALIKQGLLIAPKEVYNELKQVDDEMLEWAKKHKTMFIGLDEEQLKEVISISSKYQRLIDPNKTIPEADPFLIALAKTRKWTVVTSEHPRTNPSARPKIPDVCKDYKIKCISLIDFFREQGWRY